MHSLTSARLDLNNHTCLLSDFPSSTRGQNDACETQTGADHVRLFTRQTVASPVTNDACCIQANALMDFFTLNVSLAFSN